MPIATPQGTLDFKSVDTITFVGASSNTVIDTTTGSLGVGVGVGGPTSNLHVVGNALITGNVSDLNVVSNVNMLHTSNTASIKLNSNVVTEFNRSKKLIKYPRVALGTVASPTSGTNGGYTLSGYTVKASDEYNTVYTASQAFTNTNLGTGDTWISGSAAYTSADGLPVANSATVAKFGQNGSWTEVGLPNAIRLHSTRVFGRHTHFAERNDTADIWASTTGTDGNWVKLTTINFNDAYTDVIPMVADIDTLTYYQYFAIQITKLAWAGTYGNIGEWELFGTPEYDPEAHGTDVVVKSVPNVPNTDWLEVYYDAKDLATMPNTVTDLSPNTNTGAVSGHSPTLDTAGGVNSFVFDGTDDYITSTLTGLSSTQYTMAGWIKVNTLDSTVNTFFGLGDWASGDGRAIGIAITGDNVIGANVKGLADAKFSEVTTGEWYHVVADFTSGNDTHLYVNGKLVDTVAGTTFAIPTNPPLFIGSRANASGTVETARLFPGSIANFRLFNRVLTTDEIWQLYAYQKEYFGHGDLGMTLKAGRLGIGTSEPRAALDVRGDIYGGMPVFFDVRFTSAPTATHAGNRIVFDTINNSRGGGFDTSTGTFTAPIAGVYKFSYFMRGNILNQSIKIKPRINGSPTFNTTSDGTDQNLLGTAFAGNDGIQGSAVCIVSLEVGGTFELIACTHGGTVSSALASLYSGFTGEYISSL